ncbi:hypothetical protein VP01_6098g1, partial [Puccinia sorghi]
EGHKYFLTIVDSCTHFCSAIPIKHKIDVSESDACTSQQNGLAKRFNQTILGSTPAILHDTGLNKCLWNKIVKTMGNRVSYLILPERSNAKLESKGLLGTLIGYNNELLSYRILGDDGRIVNTRNLSFLDFACQKEANSDDDNLLIINEEETQTTDASNESNSALYQVSEEEESEYTYLTSNPTSFKISMESSQRAEWTDAVNEELDNIEGPMYGKTNLRNPILIYALLRKSLYVIKQAPANWYDTLTLWFNDINFVQSTCNPCLYIHKSKKSFIFFRVDDLIVIGDFNTFESVFLKLFPNSSTHYPNNLLGMELSYDSNSVSLSQK